LKRVAELLAGAELPIILADRVGRNTAAVKSLIELAEVGSIPVVDVGGTFNFPNTHPLDATGTELIGQSDLILLLDVDQPEVSLIRRDRYPRGSGTSIVRPGAKVVAMGLTDLLIRSTTTDFGRMYPTELTVAADTSLALPQLAAELRARLAGSLGSATLDKRKERVAESKAAARKRWQEQAEREYAHNPISHARLAAETGKAIQGDKWIVQGNAEGWTRRLWEMDRPGSVVTAGGAAGLGTGIARAVGIGLAARDQGGYCVAFNGDGDFFYDPSAIWTAVHHKIPVLAILLDNGGYIGEGGHVIWTAEQRERSTARQDIATHIRNPWIDIAALARSYGAHAEGPIEDPEALGPALQRAVKAVKDESTLALLAVRVE
jgi:thiamine pyrophosphate-dependent acetolactate synthase large subunit-like protein